MKIIQRLSTLLRMLRGKSKAEALMLGLRT